MINDDTIVGSVFTVNGTIYVTLQSYKNFSLYTRAEVDLKEEYREEVMRLVPDKMIEISELEYHRLLNKLSLAESHRW